VPLAIPSIAGPSALATVMLMASRDPAKIGSWALALTVAMAATTVVLALADRLQRFDRRSTRCSAAAILDKRSDRELQRTLR
jgi:small neutral amino acid transporter SnatA (MarC family)